MYSWISAWGGSARKTEPFRYDCLNPWRTLQRVKKFQTYMHFSESGISFMASTENAQSWRQDTCWHISFTLRGLSPWEPYLTVEKKNVSVCLCFLVFVCSFQEGLSWFFLGLYCSDFPRSRKWVLLFFLLTIWGSPMSVVWVFIESPVFLLKSL